MRLSVLIACLSLSCWAVSPAMSGFALRALSRRSEAGVVSAVLRQIGRVASKQPRHTICPTCLIQGTPRVRTRAVKGSVSRSKLRAAVLARGLPAEVASRLQALTFARSVLFQTFRFEVDSLVRRGHYETYIGAGRRLTDSDTVEFGVVHSVATGQLVAKTTPVRRRKCKRRFFIKRCRSWTDRVPRGLTAQELRQVEAALRHSAVASASAKLKRLGIRARSRRQAETAVESEKFDLDFQDD
ncbi:hypothetical protein BOX15_Mlig022805g3 [Macrostomum lignano]|uniref:Uncharacterized protein n=1 Tax=Macrostomum lignano TaxID=282301 RepID=A0A267DR35_9PLAT|nr:hypothetical protein BOX15_Mlig022805g3 [Macrostomum lignano]